MQPFKNLLNSALVQAAGSQLQTVGPAFDNAGFVRHATQGFAQLELKARAMKIADALEATRPAQFDAACNVIEAALAPGEVRTLGKSHALRAVTTRRYHAGRHAVDVRINGQAVARAGFSLALE